MKVNKVKKSTSRKKSSLFWQGKMICKHASCQCTVSIKIPPDQKTLQMTFSGKVTHIRKMEVAKPHSSDFHRDKLSNIDSDYFAAGNRRDGGTTPNIFTHAKSECRSTQINHRSMVAQKMESLAFKIVEEDKCLAKATSSEQEANGFHP